jgi:MarR family transcriptional regulator, lower aerobic nicotinate degradation pathway regulator
MPATKSRAIDLASLPGHHIRRLHQIAVAVFLQEMEPMGLTPVQYAVLQSVHNVPGVDQRTLAGTIGQDTSTTGGVLDRLEARGLLERSPSADDRRVRLLSLTPAGQDLLAHAIPNMQRAQERMLQPLPKRERVEFMRMLQTLVNANNELSRAPSEGG